LTLLLSELQLAAGTSILFALGLRAAARSSLALHPCRLTAVLCALAAAAIDALLWKLGRADGRVVLVLAVSLVSAATDLQNGHVFDIVLLPAALIWMPHAIATGHGDAAVAGAAGGAAALGTLFGATRGRAIGLGDVKLAAVLGLPLGFLGVLHALFFGFVLGGATAAALLALRRIGRGQALPFAPFLAAGAACALVIS